jgi:chaperonin GroES
MAKKTEAIEVGKKNDLMNLRPLFDRVLIKPEMLEEISSSGLIIPDSVKKDKSKYGTVVAIGSGKVLEDGSVKAMTVAVGDRVLFRAGWDNEVVLHDVEYVLIPEAEVMATL